MKVTVENEDLKFPCLMIHPAGSVIIATERTKDGFKGSLVFEVKGVSKVQLGCFDDQWNDLFEPLKGKITLQND